MNHHDIDPSLCTGEPRLESLDDGFSPPPAHETQAQSPGGDAQAATQPAELALSAKSLF
jgi:hypothetical protein